MSPSPFLPCFPSITSPVLLLEIKAISAQLSPSSQPQGAARGRSSETWLRLRWSFPLDPPGAAGTRTGSEEPALLGAVYTTYMTRVRCHRQLSSLYPLSAKPVHYTGIISMGFSTSEEYFILSQCLTSSRLCVCPVQEDMNNFRGFFFPQSLNCHIGKTNVVVNLC